MENPYQSSVHAGYATGDGQVSLGAMQALAATRPWVRLCSIIGFISSGLMIVGSVGMILSSAISRMGGAEVTAMVMGGGVYLVLAALYLIPSVKLWKYGSAIVRLLGTSSTQDMEEALHQQRGFWKFAGIMIIVMIALMILTMLGGFFFAFFAAAARS